MCLGVYWLMPRVDDYFAFSVYSAAQYAHASETGTAAKDSLAAKHPALRWNLASMPTATHVRQVLCATNFDLAVDTARATADGATETTVDLLVPRGIHIHLRPADWLLCSSLADALPEASGPTIAASLPTVPHARRSQTHADRAPVWTVALPSFSVTIHGTAQELPVLYLRLEDCQVAPAAPEDSKAPKPFGLTASVRSGAVEVRLVCADISCLVLVV